MEIEGFGSQEEEPAQEPEEDLKNLFLNDVDPNDRPILEKYVDQWDSGAKARFKKYQDEISTYKKFGPPEELERYINFGNAYRADPESFFRTIYQTFAEQYGDKFTNELFRILDLGEPPVSDVQQDFGQEEPDEFQAFQQNVSKELEDLRQFKQNYEASVQQQQDSEQLDAVLEQMHNQYGEFDEDYVLSKLVKNGGNIPAAMKEWEKHVTSIGGRPVKVAPKTLGGQGGVPANQVDPTKLQGKDRRALVAQLLESGGN